MRNWCFITFNKWYYLFQRCHETSRYCYRNMNLFYKISFTTTPKVTGEKTIVCSWKRSKTVSLNSLFELKTTLLENHRNHRKTLVNLRVLVLSLNIWLDLDLSFSFRMKKVWDYNMVTKILPLLAANEWQLSLDVMNLANTAVKNLSVCLFLSNIQLTLTIK